MPPTGPHDRPGRRVPGFRPHAEEGGDPTPVDADHGVVQRRAVLEAPPAEVWRALTDPAALDAWWGEGTTLDAVPGGTGRFVEDGEPTRVGVVVEARPHERLRLDWWPEDPEDDEPARRVTVDLAPCPFGTVVTVTEAALVDLVVHPPVLLAPHPWSTRTRPGPVGLLART